MWEKVQRDRIWTLEEIFKIYTFPINVTLGKAGAQSQGKPAKGSGMWMAFVGRVEFWLFRRRRTAGMSGKEWWSLESNFSCFIIVSFSSRTFSQNLVCVEMVPERGVLQKEEEKICNCSHLWQSENSHPHGTLGQSMLPWLLSIQQNPTDAKRYNKGQASRTTISVWQKERYNKKSVNI